MSRRPSPLAWIPVPVVAVMMLLLWMANLPASYESHFSRMWLNFIFLTLVSLVVTALVARSFLASGRPGQLLISCGSLFWSAAGTVGTAVSLTSSQERFFDANIQVTLFNTFAWLSACCHLAGVAFPIRWNTLALRAPRWWLMGALAAVVTVGSFVTVSVQSGWTPFFLAADGTPTSVRQLMLFASSAMFILTAALLREQHRKHMPALVAWYSIGLVLLALGLIGIALAPSIGSALGWLSRGTQYLSAAYMLAAAIAAVSVDNPAAALGPVRYQSMHAYGIAITLALAAAIVRLVFLPNLGPHALFVTFYPAVMLAALYAGFQSGVVATVTSLFLGSYFWIDRGDAPPVTDRAVILAGALFFLGAIMVSRIIESMHRAIARMQENEIELEQRVVARTQEIAALNTQLLARTHDAEAASRAKSAFLSTMSHEIRTPLNAIVGLTGLLAESAIDRRQRDYGDKLLLSAQALRMLIDDILDFSRIEAGALRLEQTAFSLNTTLRTMAAIMSSSLRNKPIEVLFDVGRGLPDQLIGDSLRLQQMLLNLVSNAVKFTEAGEIVISVRRITEAPGRITLQFAIRDTGIGIAADELDRIFEVFTQANFSTARQYGGTGLGLAISARIAELMGSRIEVESTPGLGSEFRFAVTLGVADEQATDPIPDGLRKLSILIVDDHPLAREVLARACISYGWQAHAVVSGPAALEELRSSSAEGRDYDLMLLDWRMPDMDGLETLRRAYATEGIGLPLVVLMTPSFELEHAIAASDDLHIDGVVAKPMTPANLFQAIKQTYAGDFGAQLPLRGKADTRLAGLRLLVAEDNAINQQVIEQTLTRAGAHVVIANNGVDAVEALRRPGARFDAVLMDLQMPVMDGYTASATIREELGMRDLPIIAVTAYSAAEDKEKARRHGMTGHLVKPIDIEDLLDIITCYGQGRSVQHVGNSVRAAAGADQVPILDVAAALQAFGGDMHKHAQLVQQFILAHGDDPTQARRHFLQNDLKSAGQLIHGLRGTASLLQASALARTAAATAHALRHGPSDHVLPLLAELQEAMLALAQSAHKLGSREHTA